MKLENDAEKPINQNLKEIKYYSWFLRPFEWKNCLGNDITEHLEKSSHLTHNTNTKSY